MRALMLCTGLAASMLSSHAGAQADGLPPPPAPGAAQGGFTLYLELVVNQQPSGQVVPVRVQDGHYHVAAEVLRALHVRTPATASPWVAVDRIDGVRVHYDSVAQRLALSVPPAWLPAQQLDQGPPAGPMPALPGRGFLLNYDVYAHNLGRGDAHTTAWSEQRWFGDWGLVSNTGLVRHFSGARAQHGGNGYLRYDTTWRHADTEAVRAYTAGDLITGALPWAGAVRIGGIQVARNFSIRPDLVPFPLPRFAGEAAVPSAVDLFINGQRAGQAAVQPGPFTLNTLPFITGAGEASVVTTDALGRQVQTSVPFYVASTLLKAGTSDYSLSAGALRRGYGLDSLRYGRPVASGHWRYGLNDRLTLEARSELARGLTLAGVGAVTLLGRWGVVNGSAAQGGSGRQWSLGYQYNTQHFSLALQHTQRTEGWRDLTRLERRDLPGSSARRNTHATASVTLGRAGALAMGYFDATQLDGQRRRLATASWSRAAGRQSFVSVHLNHAIGGNEHTAQLQWTLLLEHNASVSMQATHGRRGAGTQLHYSRMPAPSGGFGASLSHADGAGAGAGAYRQASATWRGQAMQLQGGLYTQDGGNASWASAAGSLVAMDGGWFAANRIHDAFALVATGVPDVGVRFENQLVGRTNARGHLLVTGVNAYHPSRFEIDTLELPDFMRAETSDQRVLLRAGSGALLRFDIQKVQAASITLVDEQHRPLPVGLQVVHAASGRSATLGWDGLVYLEGVAGSTELQVQGPNFATCRARVQLPDAGPGVVQAGPVVCRAP